MESPGQTPDYLRRSKGRFMAQLGIVCALFVGGLIAVVISFEARDAMSDGVWRAVVAFGVVCLVLSVLIPVRYAFKFKRKSAKERALREVGTVELLSAASSLRKSEDVDAWELSSELQIRLDSGRMFSGYYRTSVETWRLREWGRPLEAWFHVGANRRCLFNPTNPDHVIVFPFANRGDQVSYNDLTNTGPDHVSFYSAT